MSTPERTREWIGEDLWDFHGIKSACCGETAFGKELGRGEVDVRCNGCGKLCDVACSGCGVLLDAPDAEHTCEEALPPGVTIDIETGHKVIDLMEALAASLAATAKREDERMRGPRTFTHQDVLDAGPDGLLLEAGDEVVGIPLSHRIVSLGLKPGDLP